MGGSCFVFSFWLGCWLFGFSRPGDDLCKTPWFPPFTGEMSGACPVLRYGGQRGFNGRRMPTIPVDTGFPRSRGKCPEDKGGSMDDGCQQYPSTQVSPVHGGNVRCLPRTPIRGTKGVQRATYNNKTRRRGLCKAPRRVPLQNARVSPARGGNVRRTKGDRGTTAPDNTRPYRLCKGPQRERTKARPTRADKREVYAKLLHPQFKNQSPQQPQLPSTTLIIPIIQNHAHHGSKHTTDPSHPNG